MSQLHVAQTKRFSMDGWDAYIFVVGIPLAAYLIYECQFKKEEEDSGIPYSLAAS